MGAGPSPAPDMVRAMFGRIAGRYDLLNTLMTFALDRRWRATAVTAASPPPDGLALDVGTGTGRLAAALSRAMPGGRVVGVDFSSPMLRAGQGWLWRCGVSGAVVLVAGDALALPFPDGTFDCVTSAFAVRNLADLEAGFREQRRVLKAGGAVVCLELCWPDSPLMGPSRPALCSRSARRDTRTPRPNTRTPPVTRRARKRDPDR